MIDFYFAPPKSRKRPVYIDKAKVEAFHRATAASNACMQTDNKNIISKQKNHHPPQNHKDMTAEKPTQYMQCTPDPKPDPKSKCDGHRPPLPQSSRIQRSGLYDLESHFTSRTLIRLFDRSGVSFPFLQSPKCILLSRLLPLLSFSFASSLTGVRGSSSLSLLPPALHFAMYEEVGE